MMKNRIRSYQIILLVMVIWSCNSQSEQKDKLQHMNTTTASQILGNSKTKAISYGGYRGTSRDEQPTIDQLKQDMRILSSININLLRTYNVQFEHAGNVLQAISELKAEDSTFEMHVMLGAWIDCENAWTDTTPNHNAEDREGNTAEIARTVDLAKKYPDIVKIIAVGNEAMVKWAHNYYVQPGVILGWVNHLQKLKAEGELDKDLWITSSDNFASWGGGDSSYHVKDLEQLIKAVDFVSLHTYPMHDTHFNPSFWGVMDAELHLSPEETLDAVMERALLYAKKQYANTVSYVHSIDSTKPVHIGETGWASKSSGYYGENGSKACDEYKQGEYYKKIRNWTDKAGITCFYFEAFDEKWKDAANQNGSENHFGLFTADGKAKYAVWNEIEKDGFNDLTRDGNPITKTYSGSVDSLLLEVELPLIKQLK